MPGKRLENYCASANDPHSSAVNAIIVVRYIGDPIGSVTLPELEDSDPEADFLNSDTLDQERGSGWCDLYLFPSKKAFMRWEHSSAIGPLVMTVFGW